MSPEDGVYTFEWFDQVMELCVKYKLNVILDIVDASGTDLGS